MTLLDQIAYRVPAVSGKILPVAASSESFLDPDAGVQWQQWLDPWLRAGEPADRSYLNLGDHALLIRWLSVGTSPSGWRMAHVLLGTPATLTTGYALQLPNLPIELAQATRNGELPRLSDRDLPMGSVPSAIEDRARSSAACEVLVPLLSRVLAGDRSIVMPWVAPHVPEAILWGLVRILTMIGDARPLSFLTCSSAEPPDLPGLFVTFRKGQPNPGPDPRYEHTAIGLATSYADGPENLRQMLTQYGIAKIADHTGRMAHLSDLWPPHPQPPAANGSAHAHRGTPIP